MSQLLTLKPILSEKAYAAAKTRGVYTFTVPSGSNKLEIERAVSDQFKVKPKTVNVTNYQPKAKRTIRQRGRIIRGQRSKFKKAYVTLKKGETLPVYAAVEAAEAKAQKAEEKAAAKPKPEEKK